MTEQQQPDRIQMYLEHLKDEGFRPSVDDDGDVVFKVEGKTYIIFNPRDDQQLFRMGAMGLWPIESADDLTLALRAASDISGRYKVAKAFVVHDNNAIVTVELFLPSPEAFKELFDRCLGCLLSAVKEFKERMVELNNESTPSAKA